MIRSSPCDGPRPWCAAHAIPTLVTLLALLALAGCATPGERATAAEEAATGFLRALREGDAQRACAALAPRAREELASSAGADCSRAVTEVPPPARASARRVDIYGGQAMVQVRGDTLFLAHFPAGWRVTAAACRPRPGQGQGYACDIQGG
jgi:hypothetical protein